jgi:hypothetical protein
MADEFAQREDNTIARLGKCHTFLRRRDKTNHEADLGPRIEEATVNLGDILRRLTQIRVTEAEEEEEEEGEPEPERPPEPPPPAGPPPPDPIFVDFTLQQCCGSGSGSGRIRNFLQDPDPE